MDHTELINPSTTLDPYCVILAGVQPSQAYLQEQLQKLPRSITVAVHRYYILTYAKHSIDYRFPTRFASTLDQAAPCTEILEAATHCICEILLLMHELVVAHSYRLELDVHRVRISLFI